MVVLGGGPDGRLARPGTTKYLVVLCCRVWLEVLPVKWYRVDAGLLFGNFLQDRGKYASRKKPDFTGSSRELENPQLQLLWADLPGNCRNQGSSSDQVPEGIDVVEEPNSDIRWTTKD